jgi:ABC-type antimicrobial peptide transport system permease subunit
MKFLSAININFKKLKFRTGKALFLILPISLLVTLGVIISSQTNNIQNALNVYVFDKIKDQNTVLQVSYQTTESNTSFGGSNRNRNIFASQTGFTDADLVKMLAIKNVTAGSINYTIPITNIKTTDLFKDKTISFNQLTALNDGLAGVYTTENFTYTEGEAIPIIINPNTFVEKVEDWGGKDTITFDFEELRASIEASRNSTSSNTESTTQTQPVDPMSQISPVKTSAITYNKDDLMGKTFTITFGGFSDIADYTVTRDGTTTTYTKLTDAEIATDLSSRTTAVSKYWDYSKLAEGVTYTFKVVGVIEEQNNNTIFVPESFSKKVMQDYINLQLDARNSTTIPTSVLNSTYTGLTYDGTEISSTSSSFGMGGPNGGFGGGMGGPIGQLSTSTTSSDSYAIPGLVIQVNSSNTSTVTGVVTDSTIFNSSAKRGNTITLKVNSLFDRTQVIEDLNSAGYAYQDINDLDVLTQIQKTLNQVSTGVVIGFIVMTSAVIILTMSKFVSESKKEIGIFRAVGFTKVNILTIYLLQGIIYTGVGYLTGMLIGIAGNFAVSGLVAKWFENFANNTINKTVSIVGTIDYSVFKGINAQSILILSVILALITLVISFFPALQASSTSPVEAIKSE